MTEKVFQIIRENDIFSSCSPEILKKILSDDKVRIIEYKKGETIFSLSDFNLSVGVFLSGSAEVIKDNGVVISVLFKGDIFGCASLFASKDYYVNNIVALRDCKVAFIDKSTVEELMKADFNFSLSFIRYLSDRLYFLNTRIVSFTHGSAQSRLAYYLYNYYKKNNCRELTVSLSLLACSIDVGRASLYRALDSLCEKGAIKKEGKLITLINEKLLLSDI